MKPPRTSRCIAAPVLISLCLSLWSGSAFPTNLTGFVNSVVAQEDAELDDDETALSSKAIKYALSGLRLDAMQGSRVSLLVEPVEPSAISPCRARASSKPPRPAPDTRPKPSELCAQPGVRRTALLKSLLAEFLTEAGIEVVASDQVATTRLHVMADVLAVDRTDMNWLLYRQNDLLAEVGVELLMVDVKSGLNIGYQLISARALQRQGFVLGFWPVQDVRKVGPGRGPIHRT